MTTQCEIRPAITAKMIEAIRLANEGLTEIQIAERLGISQQAANYRISRAVAAGLELRRMPRGRCRTVQLSALGVA